MGPVCFRRVEAFAVVGAIVAAAVGGAWRPSAATGASPGPAPVANGPQTIYDPTLRVTWAADADLAANHEYRYGIKAIRQDGAMDYATAKRWIAELNKHDYLGHRNWQLPVTPNPYSDPGCSSNNHKFGLGCTKASLAHLYHDTLGLSWPSTAVSVPDAATGPFNDFQPYLYWSDTPATNITQGFRTISFNTGLPGSNQPIHPMYVLPMLPGNPFGGSASPALQSVDNGQAVYEPGTKKIPAVTWLADADLAKSHQLTFGLPVTADGSMDEPTASTWAQDLDTAQWQDKTGWLGQSGWSLPTSAEVDRLYLALEADHYLSPAQPVVPVPNTTLHGFTDIQPYLYWSCAGPSVQGACHGKPNKHPQQYSFSFGSGFLGTDLTSNYLYVMVYFPPAPPKRPLPPGGCPPPHQPGQPIRCQ
jgi:hypothetical protein